METIYLMHCNLPVRSLRCSTSLWTSANDAVNFTSIVSQSKGCFLFKTVLFITGLGVFIGAALSNGMMEQSPGPGIYQPQHFYFAEIMCIPICLMLNGALCC